MTTAITTTTTNNPLHSDALPLVDLRFLSHSDLVSLSLSSSSSLSLKTDADLSTPKIDRSVFNESAGSRKQTFSRLRLAPPRNYYSQFASDSISSIPNPNQNQNQTNVIGKESSEIVSLLKSFFGCQNEDVEENYENALPPVFVPITVPLQLSDVPYLKKSEDVNVSVFEASGVKKRKRGRPRRDERNVGVVSGTGEIAAREGVRKEDEVVKASENGGEGGNYQLERVEEGIVNVSEKVGEGEIALLVRPEDVNKERGEGEKALLVRAVDVNVIVSVPTELGTKKRKRGRPRKNERNVRIESENKVIVLCSDVKKAGVGVTGNARVEDPYGEELRRKTEGMQTKEELVGYLNGVEGVWIGGRKKTRVVNAAEFGGVLPTGWKLMISVKRRAGFAWLACKRFLSPNGRQFVSCKEASSYLHCLSGLQDGSLTDPGHKDSRVYLTHNLSSGNAADSSVKDDKNVDEPVCSSALPNSPSINKFEKQTTSLKIESSSEVSGGKKYKCHKCSMTLNEPDDLLQHFQMSHQRVPKRHRHAALVTEEAIMIDGKYQCQLCDKTYEERHRFNGHLGNHIKDYLKRLNVSGGVTKSPKNSMPTSTAALSIDLMIQPIQNESNDLEIPGVKYSEIQSTASAETCEGKHGPSVCSDVAYEVNEARNAVPAKIDVSPVAEPALLNDKWSTILQPSDEKKVLECTVDGARNVCIQVSSQSSSHGSLTDQACPINNSEISFQPHNPSSVWLVPPANSQIFSSTNSGNFNRNPVEKLTPLRNSVEKSTPYRNPVEKLTPYRNPAEKLTPYRNPAEKLVPHRNPESNLHRPPNCKQTHEKNSDNGTRTESNELNQVNRFCNTESHVGYGHDITKPKSNVSFEAAQGSDSKEYPLYPPGYQPTVHTNHTEQLTALNGSNIPAQKQTRNSTDGSFWLSGKEQPQIVENNLSWDFMGGNHVEPRLADSKISRKNEVLNGLNNQILSNEHPMLDFMWRNDELLGGFVDTSSHIGQTAGGFPASDVMPDKGQSAYFGEKFDGTSAIEGLRSGGMGNTEFNFLTSFMDSQSSESKTNAFNEGETQGYGSSVWPQKDALPLLPKMARQHRVMCSYCRNEFQYDSFKSEVQANSMGYACVSCKAKFSSPYNFF